MPNIYVISKVVPGLQTSHRDNVSDRAVILPSSAVQKDTHKRKILVLGNKKQMLDVSTSESIALWEARKFNLRYRMVGLSILFAIICNFLFLKTLNDCCKLPIEENIDIAKKINNYVLY